MTKRFKRDLGAKGARSEKKKLHYLNPYIIILIVLRIKSI